MNGKKSENFLMNLFSYPNQVCNNQVNFLLTDQEISRVYTQKKTRGKPKIIGLNCHKNDCTWDLTLSP